MFLATLHGLMGGYNAEKEVHGGRVSPNDPEPPPPPQATDSGDPCHLVALPEFPMWLPCCLGSLHTCSFISSNVNGTWTNCQVPLCAGHAAANTKESSNRREPLPPWRSHAGWGGTKGNTEYIRCWEMPGGNEAWLRVEWGGSVVPIQRFREVEVASGERPQWQ